MDEIRDLLESEELRAAVEAIQNLERKWGAAADAIFADRFTDIAVPRFHAAKILQVLLDPSPRYPGQKDVLAAGLAGWVLFPTKPEVRIIWMTHAILSHMDDAERRAGLAEEPWSLGRDIAARYVFGGSMFLDEIYNEIGGYEALGRSSPQEILDAIHDTDVRAVRTVARAMAYLHHGAILFEPGGPFHRPSVNRIVHILDAVRGAELRSRRVVSAETVSKRHAFVGRSLLHKRWGQGKGTVALIYAASRLPMSKRRTLLDDMLDGYFSYERHGHLIKQWLGMARYASETIFGAMGDRNHSRATARITENVESLSFPAPRLREHEKREIQKEVHKRKQ